jgi:hypothetical protein
MNRENFSLTVILCSLSPSSLVEVLLEVSSSAVDCGSCGDIRYELGNLNESFRDVMLVRYGGRFNQ